MQAAVTRGINQGVEIITPSGDVVTVHLARRRRDAGGLALLVEGPDGTRVNRCEQTLPTAKRPCVELERQKAAR